MRGLWWAVLVLAGLLGLTVKFGVLQQDPTVFFPLAETPAQQRVMEVVAEQLSDTRQANEPVMLAVTLPGTSSDWLALSTQLASALAALDGVASVHNRPQAPPLSGDSPLFAYRFLLADWRSADLHTTLADFWARWQWALPAEKQALLADPDQAWGRYLKQASAHFPADGDAPVWHSLQGGQHRVLFLISLDARQDYAALHRQLTHLRLSYPQTEWAWSSRGYLSWHTRWQVESTMQWMSLASFVLLALFLTWRLRRAAALMLVFMPLMLSTLAAFWVVQLVFGHVHPLTVALGMVLLGVSVDYPIHLLLHKSPQQAWLGVRLAIVTTLVGYLSWFALTSEGFSQLAWFSVSGLVFMLVILAWMRRLGAGAVGLSAPSSLSQPLPSGLALLLLLPFLAWGVKPLYWQDDLASMSPISPQALAQDGQLRQLFGQPQVDQIVLVDAANEAALLQKLDALEPSLAALAAQGVLAQSLSLADWLPSAARQSARQQMLPDQAALMAAVSELALPFRAEHWQPFFDAVAQTANLPVLDVRGFSAQALDWQQAFLPYLVRVDEQQAVARIWLFDVRDSAALAQWARDEGVELVQQRAFIEAQIAELRQRVSQILFLMLVLFVLGLALSYRRLRPVLSVAGSVILTALVTLSSLHALLPALSVFHLVALVLVLAMSVDYAVFAEQVKRQTGDLVSVNTALITSLLTFSLLLLAPIPLLVAMGQTLVIGVLSAYLSARLLHRV